MSTGHVDPSPSRSVAPWERSEFRFWTWSISAVAFLAVALGIIAIAVSHPDGSASGSTKAADAAPAIPSKINFDAQAPDEFTPSDPTAPAPLPGTVHDVTMHIKDVELEVAPGVKQMMWTFDGTVPGPTYRGKIGDTFRFTIVNDGAMTHSMDFHSGMVSPSVAMVSIDPGKSHVYEFVANHAGIFMYHCGTPPVLQHIGAGMYGAVIIDPPDLAPVDHEYVMVQSELYLGKDGAVPELPNLLAMNYDAVVFNGSVFQYKYAPIKVQPNERIRVWVIDDGPSQVSSFHVIGTIFDTVYKEGAYLLQPGAGGSQALDLMPAQGGFVEFQPTEAGNYAFVTHKFNDAARGAIGVFQVGDTTSTMSH